MVIIKKGFENIFYENITVVILGMLRFIIFFSKEAGAL